MEPPDTVDAQPSEEQLLSWHKRWKVDNDYVSETNSISDQISKMTGNNRFRNHLLDGEQNAAYTLLKAAFSIQGIINCKNH